MPKSRYRFDCEIYDKSGEFLDILTLTRDQIKEYRKKHPDHKVTELERYDDRDDDARKDRCKKRGYIYGLCDLERE